MDKDVAKNLLIHYLNTVDNSIILIDTGDHSKFLTNIDGDDLGIDLKKSKYHNWNSDKEFKYNEISEISKDLNSILKSILKRKFISFKEYVEKSKNVEQSS